MIQRYSKQRETLLQYLRSVTCHPTAETVYLQVRKEIPNISLGTVYRNLNQLAEEGTILRLTANNGADYYDGFIQPHLHILCTRCGKIDDGILRRVVRSFGKRSNQLHCPLPLPTLLWYMPRMPKRTK